jgi:N-acetylneuraminic acid mutarotase
MKTRLLLAAGSVFLLLACTVRAQVPSLLNYQGRIAVSGTNFDGSGQFKFSLVNSTGTTTFWSNDGSASGGAQPTAAVTLTVTKGLYSVLLGDTTLVNMTAVPAGVFTNSDVRLRVWFNDGVNGFQLLSPDQRIAAVGYAMMAATVPDGAITTSKIASGAVTAAQLGAGAAATNLQASGQSGVGSSGIILSTSANAASLLAQGYVRVPSLKVEGNVEKWRQRKQIPFPNPFTPAAREGNNTVIWTGTEMIVWGGSIDGTDVNTGGRYNPATDSWAATSSSNNVPEPGSSHTAVWTGTEMIVWGGTLGNHGWRYNPATDTWIATPTAGAPSARSGHAAVWTGTQMIIYFGSQFDTNLNQMVFFNDGYRYSNNVWTAISATGTPTPRSNPLYVYGSNQLLIFGGYTNDLSGIPTLLADTARFNPTNSTWVISSGINPLAPRWGGSAVWVGNQMIAWGGYTNDPVNGAPVFLNTGGRYFPGAGWSNMITAPISPRAAHVAASSGSRMIVWGGATTNLLFDGAVYNTNDTWTTISTTSAPSARTNASAIWSGTEMIVWGGSDGNSFVNTGGRYNLAGNTWTNTFATLTPSGRAYHSAVWTGTEMILWGGFEGESLLNSGARYNPTLDSWVQTASLNAPIRRAAHTAVWTGTQMVVWGGTNATGALNSGGRYNPISDTWTATTITGAPTNRWLHSAIWSGTEMIVWGGNSGLTNLNTGGRYNPTGDTWTALTTTAAPSPRESHTAVWDGTGMIVWGGDFTNVMLGDGARFSTNSGTWTALPSLNAPSARTAHAAVWTGTDMIVWGGFDGTNNLATGARYNLGGNAWTPIEKSGAPFADPNPNGVWSGTEMIVWSGSSGGRYDPVADSWHGIESPPGFDFREHNSAVWGGTEMLLFGGTDGFNFFDSLFSYVPPQILYIYQKP